MRPEEEDGRRSFSSEAFWAVMCFGPNQFKPRPIYKPIVREEKVKKGILFYFITRESFKKCEIIGRSNML